MATNSRLVCPYRINYPRTKDRILAGGLKVLGCLLNLLIKYESNEDAKYETLNIKS